MPIGIKWSGPRGMRPRIGQRTQPQGEVLYADQIDTPEEAVARQEAVNARRQQIVAARPTPQNEQRDINAPISFDPIQGAYGRDLMSTNPSAAKWIDMMTAATGGRGRIDTARPAGALDFRPGAETFAGMRNKNYQSTAGEGQTPLFSGGTTAIQEGQQALEGIGRSIFGASRTRKR